MSGKELTLTSPGQLESFDELVTVPSIGTIGVLCGIETTRRVVRVTSSGPLRPAKCNRWHGHDGAHVMTTCKPRQGFRRLYEWGEDECAAPDWTAERRREMAAAKIVAGGGGSSVTHESPQDEGESRRRP